MKKYIIAMIVLLAVATICSAQQGKVCSGMLQAGEELRYKVKWNFLRLGTITIRAERVSGDTNLRKLTMQVDSNPALVFVRIREYNESVVDPTTMMSQRFLGVHNNSDEHVEIRSFYLAPGRVLYLLVDSETGKPLRADTLENVPEHVEGPSLFYYARWLSRSKQIVRVATFAGGERGFTELDFTLGREYLEIDAFDEPVRTRKYKGFIHGKGGTSAGLSGEFFGWVSDDDAAVPIQAEMKILLGSVRLELEKWVRPGWTPPVYVELVKK